MPAANSASARPARAGQQRAAEIGRWSLVRPLSLHPTLSDRLLPEHLSVRQLISHEPEGIRNFLIHLRSLSLLEANRCLTWKFIR